jgi:hypothetical protein
MKKYTKYKKRREKRHENVWSRMVASGREGLHQRTMRMLCHNKSPSQINQEKCHEQQVLGFSQSVVFVIVQRTAGLKGSH